MAGELVNASFESGATGWTFTGGFAAVNDPTHAYAGAWLARATGAFGTGGAKNITVPVFPGQVITASCFVNAYGDDDEIGGNIRLAFDDIGSTAYAGNVVVTGQGWRKSTVSGTAPAGATHAFIQGEAYSLRAGGVVDLDAFEWNYNGGNRTITIATPADNATYEAGKVISFTSTITGTTPPVTSVTYKRGATVIGTATTAPYTVNSSAIPEGSYVITAELLGADGSITTSAPIDLNISAALEDREYRASNSYTYLVAESFTGLSAAMPLTALVTAVELVLDYNVTLLIRSKDLNVTDPADANPNVIFDVTDGAKIEAVLLTKEGEEYTSAGGPISADVPLDEQDFDTTEDGLTEGKRWTVMESNSTSVTVGDDTTLFGLAPIAASDFIERSIGIRFIPILQPMPAYADSGDACVRVFIDKIRLRVYFDAGSAEYYFASPDKTQVLKGELIHATVDDGNLQTSDASGTLQLAPELEIKDGTTTWIGSDWTIHAAYPPTDANQIGLVTERGTGDEIGMRYNGLPTQQQIVDNRSRYMFITNNFYGDKDLDSIYGAHGLPRAFAFNGDEFYKIHTQSDPLKDSPRHVAYHHFHLALGFNEGRVDISVAGKPYSFDGLLGASSWAIGDKVVGLLPLSGTILGVFGSKSIWGISGTTVDNFATQVIVPNIGAIEYTVTDMGFPVYANAYGIYTLAQAQQYGDYLGSPMSQDVSPWLRPRLVRKYASDKEVVVAWPVRSKNQYRLAFSDGYVMSMTLNAGQQSAPTFSKQQYIIYTPEDE